MSSHPGVHDRLLIVRFSVYTSQLTGEVNQSGECRRDEPTRDEHRAASSSLLPPPTGSSRSSSSSSTTTTTTTNSNKNNKNNKPKASRPSLLHGQLTSSNDAHTKKHIMRLPQCRPREKMPLRAVWSCLAPLPSAQWWRRRLQQRAGRQILARAVATLRLGSSSACLSPSLYLLPLPLRCTKRLFPLH